MIKLLILLTLLGLTGCSENKYSCIRRALYLNSNSDHPIRTDVSVPQAMEICKDNPA